jgi:hypothetical protein
VTESGIVDELNVVFYYTDEPGSIIPVQLEMDKLDLESIPRQVAGDGKGIEMNVGVII